MMSLAPTTANCQVSVPLTQFKYLKPNIVNDTNNLAAALQAYRSGQISKGEIMAVTLATLNDEPISFYGKLEDQFSNAVAMASINFDVRIMNGIDSTVERGQAHSDSKGFFSISGYHGQDLNMVPRKEGYVLSSMNTYCKYSRLDQDYFVPNSNSPVLIKMWKTQGEEPLVGIGKSYKLPYTNTPICFDLLAGKIVSEGGDICLTVARDSGVITARNPVPWCATFSNVAGGIMESAGTERFTYFAPEDGYKTSLTIFPTNRMAVSGVDGFGTGFYVKSRNGQVYSKLGVRVRINESTNDPMYIEFSGWANTNSSRNWEGAGNTYLNPN